MQIPSAGLLGLMALSPRCGAGRSFHSQPASPAAEARGGRARAEIDNQNFSDMKIYLMDAGIRAYIGMAPGLSRTSLVIPGSHQEQRPSHASGRSDRWRVNHHH